MQVRGDTLCIHALGGSFISFEFQMPGGGCLFQTKWKSDSQFKDWIKETNNIHSAYCKLCKKNVDIKTMGRTALTSNSHPLWKLL